MKNSKFLSMLLAIFIASTLILSNTSKVDACSFWNPFCKNTDVLRIPGPLPKPVPLPRVHPISPEDGGKTWINIYKTDFFANFYFSSSFTQDELNFMKYALLRLRTNGFYRSDFITCTSKYTNESSPDNDLLKQTSTNSVFSQLSSRKSTYIVKIIDPEIVKTNTVARAPIGLNTDYFFMRINPSYLRPISSDLEKTSHVSTIVPDAALIGGAMVHEMLHNLGFIHDKYKNTGDPNDAIGNFVYEAGWCITRIYKDKPQGTFGLTDPSNYHVD